MKPNHAGDQNNNRHAQDHTLDAVLTAMREAEPADGFEQRILDRLATEPHNATKPTWRSMLQPRFALPTALVTCALALILSLHRGSIPAGRHEVNQAHDLSPEKRADPEALSAATNRSSAPTNGKVQVRAVAASAVPSHSSRSAELLRERNDAACASAQAGRSSCTPSQMASLRSDAAQRSAHDPSFPAPEMPLTEQERLLIRIAHRNDPVEVAMLNPEERGLQRDRERAETAHFFAPQPLPAELHDAVKAALRSQYVNTPAPDDKTLEAMTTRSLP